MNDRPIVYKSALGDLADVPGTPFAYWASKSLRDLFQRYPPLDRDVSQQIYKPKISDTKQGLATADDLRFIRYWWEVPVDRITIHRKETYRGKSWVPLNKGGKSYFHDITFVINWVNDGEEIRNFQGSVIRNEVFYFREGLAWPNIISNENLRIFRLRPGIFTHVSPGIFPHSLGERDDLLGVLNSKLCYYLYKLLDPMAHHSEVGTLARLPIKIDLDSGVGNSASDIFLLHYESATGDETITSFVTPWILQSWTHLNKLWDENSAQPTTFHPMSNDFEWSDREVAQLIRHWLPDDAQSYPFSLRLLAEVCVKRERMLRQQIQQIQTEIDDKVFRLYELSPKDRALIETELSRAVYETDVVDEIKESSESETEELQLDAENLMPAEDHLHRLVHYLAHEALKADQDGIVPLWDTYLPDGRLELGLAERVKESLSDTFGPENLDTCLFDLQEAFGMSLDDWLETEFFPYHVGLYRLRPIVWQVTSQRRGPAVFSCFVYWHKLDNDTLRKIQQVYLVTLINAAQQEADRLGCQLVDQRNAGMPLRQLRELERYSRQAEARLNELKTLNERITAILQPHMLQVTSRSEWVKEKVNKIIAHGYRPMLDYGVRVNIEPLKQAGVLPQAVDRVKG